MRTITASARGTILVALAAIACASSGGRTTSPEATSSVGSRDESAHAVHIRDDDWFSSDYAGFSITKLPNWVFGKAEWEAAARERTSIGSDELDRAVREHARLPLVVVTRYPEPSDKPNPTLKVGLRPIGPFEGKTPVDAARAIVEVMRPALRQFELVGEVLPTRVGGLPAAEFQATFEINVEETSYFVRSRTWVVPRGPHLFMISASSPDGAHDDEFSQMVATTTIREKVGP